jgi:hypothetical protein
MRNYLFIIVSILLLISCKKDQENVSADNNLEISMGTICGMTGGNSISVSRKNIIYQSDVFSKKEGKMIITPVNEWNDLISTLDYMKFKNINLNTCNRCLDGCDNWISIKADTTVHTIYYWADDIEKLKEIQPLIEKLEYLRSQFY